MPFYLFKDSTNCSGFRKYGCGFRKFAYFGSNFERYSVLDIFCGTQNSKEDERKVAKLRIPQQIYIWPVADSAYNAQNAQFGLVRIESEKNCSLKIWVFSVIRLNFDLFVILKTLSQ